MTAVSTRLSRRIKADFPDAGSAPEVERIVGGAADSERVQAAIVLAAKGDLRLVQHGVELAGIDWRDVLVNGGLADETWPELLDAELGPAGPGEQA